MRDRDDKAVRAEVQAIERHATVHTLRDDANKVAKIYAGMNEQDRARLIVLLFGPDDGQSTPRSTASS